MLWCRNTDTKKHTAMVRGNLMLLRYALKSPAIPIPSIFLLHFVFFCRAAPSNARQYFLLPCHLS